MVAIPAVVESAASREAEMSAYSDGQSEDGELARSPPEAALLDFSLSEEEDDAEAEAEAEGDTGDSLDIKPPQAKLRPSARRKDERRERRAERETDGRKERDRSRKKRSYSGDPRAKYPDRHRERHKAERDARREKDSYRIKDPYGEKERRHRKEREHRGEKERIVSRHPPEKARRRIEVERRPPSRDDFRLARDDAESPPRRGEKENGERPPGDRELEDLRSRLLSKKRTKERREVPGRRPDERIERDPPERRDAPPKARPGRDFAASLAESVAEANRAKASRTVAEVRRERLAERGAKRPGAPPSPPAREKRSRRSRATSPSPPTPSDDVVTVSDASDVETESEKSRASRSEEGTASSSESSTDTSPEETDTEGEKDESREDDRRAKNATDGEDEKTEEGESAPPSPRRPEISPESAPSATSKRESRSRSRSASFSPPPAEENGATEETAPAEAGSPTPPEEKVELPPYYPALQGCRSVEEFQCLNRIEEGTYGVVYRARDKTTDEIVALKRLKMEKEKEGFPITSLREINTLLKGQHPNIVTVREIVVGSNMDKIFIVMDYVEHDLKGLMETMRNRKQVFLPGEIKCLMQQLLRAVDHLHDNWILHRDLKTSNLLLSHKGILKVGDFGLAREYGSPLKSYTPIVVTLWYRAPELLLGAKQYSTPIDMWSVGCIFAEFITMHALFPGKSEVDQLNKIFKELGTPNETIMPGWNALPGSKATWADHPGGSLRNRVGPSLSESGLNLLNSLLTFDPQQRATAHHALCHNYFKEQPLAIDPAMFPTWPAKSEGGRRHQHSPKPPSGGDQYKLLREDDQATGFHMGAPAPALAPYLPPSSGFSLKF